MNLRETLSKIQTELKAKKGQTNAFGKYSYRSAEDVLEALKPLNQKYNTYVVITESLLAEGVLQSEATISNIDGESISANAIVGIDMNQKGMSLPQKYGSASSYGKKYALGNLFAIDNTADADALNKHGNEAPKKELLTESSSSYVKVITALKAGSATIEQVQSKFNVTPELLTKLKSI